MQDLASTILAYINQPNYRPVKPRILAKNLGFDERRDEVKATIKQLIKTGKIAYGSKHLVLPVVAAHAIGPSASPLEKARPKKDRKHITGTLRRVASGDGYVRPAGTLASEGREADIYVSAKNAGDAASGDVVRLR